MENGTLIKIKLFEVKKKQVDLLRELWNRGYPRMSASLLSRYINGLERGPQAGAVLKVCDDIIREWERKAG